MEINIPQRRVHAASPIVLVLEDKGGAHVSITLSIQGFPPIVHDDTYGGAKPVPVHISPGIYRCTVLIEAYKYGALNAHYDSTIHANGTLIVSAAGNIPPGQDSDIEFDNFELVVA